jgi:hypothetical protein
MTDVTDFSKARGLQSPGFISRHRKLLTVIFFLCAARAIFPGDVPWIQDEAMIFSIALRANQDHHLAVAGVTGSFGRPYGPIPIWIYQAILLFTHDLRAIVTIRGILSSASIAAGLLLLADAAELWTPFSAIALVSPYLWMFTRELWDNTFNLPLAALCFGFFANFLRTRSALSLHATIALLVIAPFIHPLAVPFSLAMLLYLLLTERRTLARRGLSIIAVLAVVAVAMSQYVWLFVHAPPVKLFHFHIAAGVGTIAGAQYLSSCGLYEFLGQQWTWGQHAWIGLLFDLLIAPTCLAYVFCGLGILIALRNIVRRRRTIREQLAIPCLAAIPIQFLIESLVGGYHYVHYFNTTWIVFAYFAWLGVTTLVSMRPGKIAVNLYAIFLAATLVFIVVRIHRTAGTRDLGFGTTLGNQLEAAETIARYSRASRLTRLPFQFWRFPKGLDVLLDLRRPATTAPLAATPLKLQYSTHNSWDAHVEVVPD